MAAARHGRVYAVIRYTRGNGQCIAVYGSMAMAKRWTDGQDDVPGTEYDIEEHTLDQDYVAEDDA